MAQPNTYFNELIKEFCKRGCIAIVRPNVKLNKLPLVSLNDNYSFAYDDDFIIVKGDGLLHQNKRATQCVYLSQYSDTIGIDKKIIFRYTAVLTDPPFILNLKQMANPESTIIMDKTHTGAQEHKFFTLYSNQVRNEIYYNTIDAIVHYLYSGSVITPTYQDIISYKNQLYPHIHEKCFGFKLVYYMYILDTHTYSDIKKNILNLMLKVDKWNELDVSVN